MSESKAKIVFTPSGKRGEFPLGTSILTAARGLGVDLDSVCGGRGICGRCQVEPSFGSFPKFAIESTEGNLSIFNEVEQRYKNKKGLRDERRLGCNCTLQGDMVIDVPEDSQIHRQVIRKAVDKRPIAVDPVVRLYVINVAEPDMHKPSGDSERVITALCEQHGFAEGDLHIHPAILPTIQAALRHGKWHATALVRDRGHGDKEVAGLWAGELKDIYGLAIDLGSTTMSLHLTNLLTAEVVSSVGAMNPQIRFGEDLMSRVSYVMMNKGGDKEMTEAVRFALNDLSIRACKEVNITPDHVVEITLVGNPVMHHLFLGIDPTELGWAPFALATNHAVDVAASDVGFALHPAARVYILPCIAGHVGADSAAVILAEEPWKKEEISLLVDVGTNAEIVLGNKDRLLACSSPTGPALEGAQISSGQRAATGAIERVRIDKDTLEPRFKIIGSDMWSNEPGFPQGDNPNNQEEISPTGICGSGIIEVIAEMMLAGIIGNDGVIDGALAVRNRRIVSDGRTFSYVLHDGDVEKNEPEIRVTQTDIRAIQLAKAALYAGCKLLIDKLGRNPDRICLAGAFGTHIEPKYALLLGMIPNCALDQVNGVGNAAGTGARVALVNGAARREIEAVVKRVEKIETAIEPKFQEYFVAAMGIPNAVDEFPALTGVVTLPPRKMGGDNRVRRRSRP
ncbi:MAG: ASKHA domain-containing protein [Alphaproteobacteria bacterium]|nr:ASKHA domain-containing protein [Alphaproteobacteria bacterium]